MDKKFLEALDSLKIRTQLAKITLLEFKSEKPIGEITGIITSGSISVNGQSSIRRTLNLSLFAEEKIQNIENLDNQISLNKKIKVEIGYKNPLKEYAHYGDTVWFPCGIYIISQASISRGTTGATISISAKDKMAQLNGEVGGIITATTVFHEMYEMLPSGEVIVSYPTIYKIIEEAVHHLGGEPLYNIIISDLDTEIRSGKQYIGSRKLYFNEDNSAFSYTKSEDYNREVEYQDCVGYEMTEFSYPGELVFQAGSTVEALLKKICEVLGNFEFFYDIEGHFIFQEIKNYLNTTTDLKQLEAKDYLRFYNAPIYSSSFDSKETVSNISRSPKYENLKNDFIVWGTRTLPSGATRDIHYRLAIDKKPELVYATQYMCQLPNGTYRFYSESEWDAAQEEKLELIRTIRELEARIDDLKKDIKKFEERIQTLEQVQPQTYEILLEIGHNRREISQNNAEIEVKTAEIKTKIAAIEAIGELVAKPCNEWREEIYRQAIAGLGETAYDAELIKEWRKLFDTMREDWEESGWWNPEVENHPQSIDFWLDFIDGSSQIEQYSVEEVGRRTKVVNDKDAKTVFNKPVPDIIFTYNVEDFRRQLEQGFNAFLVQPNLASFFVSGGQAASCYEKIRELLYQNLTYNTTITITCLPRYYLEPNTIISIEDAKSGITGNFLINSFTLPLTYNGTMSITASEVLSRV